MHSWDTKCIPPSPGARSSCHSDGLVAGRGFQIPSAVFPSPVFVSSHVSLQSVCVREGGGGRGG